MLEYVRPGRTYDVAVIAEGFGSTVLAGVLATESVTQSAVALPELGAVDLRVTRGGERLASACLELARVELAVESKLDRKRRVLQRTDAQGAFQRSGLDPGRWMLTVSFGDLLERRAVAVPAGGTARVEVDLP